MKIAILYANWEKFGELWSTPMGVIRELERRGHEVTKYNLYHDEGMLLPGKNIRQYSNQGLNKLLNDYREDPSCADVIFLMDYGPYDSYLLDKKNFPGAVLLKECGDEPQSHAMHSKAVGRFHHMLSPDYECVKRYHTMGYEADFWTHHADEQIFYPRPEIEEVFDCVTTCGPRGQGLTEEIKEALGDRFNNERYFHGDEHAERLCMGKIVFQCSQYGEVTRRIFEGVACGKMILTDRLNREKGLETIFKEGQSIVFYDDAQDAIEKIKFYSENEEERLRIAKNGYEIVMNSETVSSRVDHLEKLIQHHKQND